MISKSKTLWAAFTALSLLGVGNVSAAPHTKNLLRAKTNHFRLTAPGTRLIATGSVNPDTSSIKAISTDNRFTWVHLTSTTIIVQRGQPVAPGSIGEGDKLICQGTWVEDAWGPIYQAKRVEVIGTVGETALQERVAAACQRIAQDGSGRASGSEPNQVDDNDPLKRQGQEYVDYIDAVQTRYAALKDAKKALVYQVGQSEGAQDRVQERLENGNPNLAKDFQSARHDFDTATDSLASISPVPPAMKKANDLIKESCAAWHGFSFRLNEDYSRIFGGDETESYSKDVMAKYDEGTRLFDEAVVETGRVADSYHR